MIKEYYSLNKLMKVTKATDMSKIGYNNNKKRYELISSMEKSGLVKYISMQDMDNVTYYWDLNYLSKVFCIYNHSAALELNTEESVKRKKDALDDLIQKRNDSNFLKKVSLSDVHYFYGSLANISEIMKVTLSLDYEIRKEQNLLFHTVSEFRPIELYKQYGLNKLKILSLLEGLNKGTVDINDPVLNFIYDLYFVSKTFIHRNYTLQIQKYEAEVKKYEEQLTNKVKKKFFVGFVKDIKEAELLGFIPRPHSINIPSEFYKKHNLIDPDTGKVGGIIYVHIDFVLQNIGYNVINYNNRTINYNANKESSTFHNAIRDYYSPLNNFRNKTNTSAFKLAKALKGLTFGIEIETCNGSLPYERMLDQTGLIPLKDGSISSYEYATVPLGLKFEKGKVPVANVFELSKDLQGLWTSLNLLNMFTTVNEYCSTHVHIGNTRKDKPFIVAFYLLCIMLQEEMLDYFPYFKRDAVKYIKAKKNYCKLLPDFKFDLNLLKKEGKNTENFNEIVGDFYNTIFEFLSNGESLGPKYNRTNKVHPLGKKWERTERYNWINMVNTIFNSEETIEFRLHSGTTNPYKIFNWILICSAMVKFAENNIKEILSGEQFRLNHVIQGYSTNFRSKKRTNAYGIYLYEYLSEYLDERKEYFKNLKKQSDFKGLTEFRDDRMYTFTFRKNLDASGPTPLIEY